MTQHLKWVHVFLRPVSNCVKVKMGSFKNHVKWVRVKTGCLREGFLCTPITNIIFVGGGNTRYEARVVFTRICYIKVKMVYLS
ncbi:hypothetical protein Hanom_Chr11g00994621 [Helianthus anomalus]